MSLSEIEHLLLKVKELLNDQSFKEAIDLLEDQLQKHPESDVLKKELINALFLFGGYLNDDYMLEYDKAAKLFTKIIKLDPENYRAHYNLGIAFYNLECLDNALEAYLNAIKIKPDYAHCLYNIGLIHELRDDLKTAIEYYDKALQINPKFSYASQAKKCALQELELQGRDSSVDLALEEALDKLTSLLNMSTKIQINMIRNILNIDEEKLLALILEWGKNYGFVLEGDYILINKETLPELLRNLKQFFQ